MEGLHFVGQWSADGAPNLPLGCWERAARCHTRFNLATKTCVYTAAKLSEWNSKPEQPISLVSQLVKLLVDEWRR